MKARRLLYIILCLFACVTMRAQRAGEISLFIEISDAESGGPVSPTVYVLDSDSTVLVNVGSRHLVFATHAACGVSVPLRSRYIVKFVKRGYETLYADVAVPQDSTGKTSPPEFVDLAVKMRRRAVQLGEATVKASRVLVVTRGDTIVFNPAALDLAEGDVLQSIIDNLPGVRLNDDGQIYVNDEYVSTLLINGREFFKGDPKLALENLPNYTVHRIKVYRRAPDDDYLRRDTLPRDNRRDPLVMDVRLKREYARGWITNAEVATGPNVSPFDWKRWMGRAFGMHYTDWVSLAAFVNANNLNQTKQPGKRGSWAQEGVRSGDLVTRNYGINLSWGNDETRVKLNTSLDGSQTRADELNEEAATRFYSAGDTYSRSRMRRRSVNAGLNWKGELTVRAPFAMITFRPEASASRWNNDASNYSVSLSGEPQEARRGAVIDSLFSPAGSPRLEALLINLREKHDVERRDTWRYGAGVNVTPKQAVKGLYTQVDFSYTACGTRHRGFTHDSLFYRNNPAASDFQNSYWRLPSSDYTLRALLWNNYNFPRRHIRPGQTNIRRTLTLNYTFEQTFRSAGRDVYRLDWLGDGSWDRAGGQDIGRLPSTTDSLELAADFRNTYRTVTRRRTHQLFFEANFFNKIIFGANVNFHDEYVHDYRNRTHAALRRHYVQPVPYVRLRQNVKKFSVSASYKYTPEAPALTYLLDTRDDLNPLDIRLGNPSLGHMRKHQLSLDINQGLSNGSLNPSFGYTRSHGAVGMARYYDHTTGVTTRRPENIDGNWLADGKVGYWQNFFPDKRIYLESTTLANYRHSVDFVYESGQPASGHSVVRTTTLGEALRLTYRLGKAHLGARANFSWTNATSHRANFTTTSTTDFDYGLTFRTPFARRYHFDTDIFMYSRRGSSSSAMSDDNLIWNAALTASALGRCQRVTLKLEGFDLLHQVSQVRRVLNSQGRTETWYNTIPSYFLLHLIYRFDIKPRETR